MIEFDEDFRNKISLEEQIKIKNIIKYQHKFHEIKNKRAFFQCINDLSYNFRNLILSTWTQIQPIDDNSDSEEFVIDPNYKNYSDSDSD